MSRNGSGTYSLPAGNPVVSGTTISSTWANTTLSDIASALTASIASDGQTPITADLPMNNHKLTGMADGVADDDSATVGQVNDAVDELTSSGSYTGTLTGITTTITVTVKWYKVGNQVTISLPPLTGNPISNAATFTITGGPADIADSASPKHSANIPCINNGTIAECQVYVNGSGVIVFAIYASPSAWAGSNPKAYGYENVGLRTGVTFTYFIG